MEVESGDVHSYNINIIAIENCAWTESFYVKNEVYKTGLSINQ